MRSDDHIRYREFLQHISNDVDYLLEVKNEGDMSRTYRDPYMTNQQKERDEQITKLLHEYIDAYQYKNKSNKWYKTILFGTCIFILLAFTIVFITLLFRIDKTKGSTSMESTIKLVSICITFLVLIVGILKIITKYIFPKREEEYITKIVQMIQSNDLEHKKENIRVNVSNKIQNIEST